MAKKLNLGCGSFKKPGFLNIDVRPETQPDILHDLDKLPYPLESNSFEVVEADHVLEHLNDAFAVMKELYRITQPGGTIVVRVPHFSRGFTHPDHKRGFDVSFPYYFQPDFQGGYTGVPLKLVSLKLRWFSQPYLMKTVLSAPVFAILSGLGAVIDFFANLQPLFCSRVWCFLVGGFTEMEVHFVKDR